MCVCCSLIQACDITGGIYLKLPQETSLLQYMLVSLWRFCWLTSLKTVQSNSCFYLANIFRLEKKKKKKQQQKDCHVDLQVCPITGHFFMFSFFQSRFWFLRGKSTNSPWPWVKFVQQSHRLVSGYLIVVKLCFSRERKLALWQSSMETCDCCHLVVFSLLN